MKQVIIVKDIKNTKNAEVKQLQLQAVIDKPATANPVSFFLRGVKNVAPSTETRTLFLSVGVDFIKDNNITVGTDFNSIPDMKQYPNAQLVVKETLTQLTWTNADGSTGYQSAKINPNTGQVLTKGGEPIYRNVTFDMAGTEESVYIQHDTITRSTTLPTAKNETSIEALVSKGSSVVSDPVLPA